MTVDIDKIRVGQRVRAEREAPAKGTWKNYEGREGVVLQVRKTLREDEREVVINEIGVDLTNSKHSTWFKPEELVLI